MLEILFSYFLFIYIFTYFLNVNIGSALLNFQITKKIDLYKAILLGFASNIVITSLFYLIFKISIQNIFIFLLILSFFCFILNIKRNKETFKIFIKPFFPILLFVFIFSYIAYKHGLQYYVFRGNYWDYFNYLASSLMIFKHDLNFLINNEILLQSKDIFPRMGWLFHLNIRPSINIYFSLLYNLKLEHFYLINFVIKTTAFFFLFSTYYIFFKNLDLKFLKKRLTLFCFLLCFLFWPIYIFEIDSLAQLFATSLFIFCFYYLMNLEKVFTSKKKLVLIQFFIIHLALFLIYPEIFLVYSFVSLIYLLLRKKTFNLIKLYKYTFLKLSILLLLVICLFYETHLVYLITAIDVGLNQSIETAGYFGSFILGQNNPVLNEIFVKDLKNLISQNVNLFTIGNFVHQGLISNGFDFYYLSILPSIFGFYQYTFNEINLINNLYLWLFLPILNIGIIFFVLKNIKNIINSSNNLSTLVKAVMLSFLLMASIFLFNSSIWSIIKLYFYFYIFLLLITIFIFDKNTISLNYPFIFLLILFPLFFYTGIKDGVGKINSFPSILDKKMKQNFMWELNTGKVKECNSIIIRANYEGNDKDILKIKYLMIYMYSNNINHMLSNDFYPSKNNEEDYECKITVRDNGFYLEKL